MSKPRQLTYVLACIAMASCILGAFVSMVLAFATADPAWAIATLVGMIATVFFGIVAMLAELG